MAVQVVPGVLWTFEQEQTFAFTNVATVVRMTVIKLQSGGLWVYAPIAPTRCAALLSTCLPAGDDARYPSCTVSCLGTCA